MKTLIWVIISFTTIFHCTAQSDKHQFSVEIPESFELANILIALTEFGQNDDNIVRKNTTYYDSVMSFFNDHKNHKAIQRLNALFDQSQSKNYRNYNYFRTGSYFYSIQDQQLVKSQHTYSNKLFQKFEDDINDFIKETDFHGFYSSHKRTYNDYISAYNSVVPLEQIIAWLNKHFPARYGDYKIVMSPLIGGYHNTIKYEASGQQATLMAVNVPSRILSGKNIDELERGKIICNVFTEIDHNYINPITDNHKRAVNKSINNIDCWNDKRQGYNSAYLTFNEYMTWAVYSIFAKEHFNDDSFELINQTVSNFMKTKRGFLKFDEFNDQLLEFYADDDKSVSNLIPKMIDWMDNYDCDKSN